MTARNLFDWSLCPATTAYVLDGLTATLTDLIQRNGADISREQ